MSEQNKGGPAFPVPAPRADSGMTLRDYFATEAMHGLIRQLPMQTDGKVSVERIAKGAYTIADAMLAERAK